MAADFAQTRIDMLRRRWQETASPHVSLQLADLYRQQGRLADAVEVLEGGLADNPESVSLRVALGRYRMESGNARGATETLRAVVESDPSHLVANKLLVKAYVLLGERQRARDRLDLYSLLNDSDPEIEVLEKSVAAGRAYFDAPRPARAAEPPAAPFDLPLAAPGPAPDLARMAGPAAAAPTVRRSADGRTLWMGPEEPFPEAGLGLGDPHDWSALAAAGLFEAPPDASPRNGRPAAGEGIAVAAAPRRELDEGTEARRRADHVEIRLRSREAPTPVEEPPVEELPVEELPVEELPVEELPVEGAPVEEAPVEEVPVEEPPVEEPPIEEPPVEAPPIEEPPIEEPPVEEPPIEEPPMEEPPVEAPPVETPREAGPDVEAPPPERPDGDSAVEEISLADVLDAEERVEAEAPHPTLTLARLYLAQGHFEEAEETFRAVLLREPGNGEARLGLAAVVDRRFGPAAPLPESDEGEPEDVWPGLAEEGASGFAEVTLDDEPELRLPRSDVEDRPDGREPIRRRIGVLRKYLDRLRAARDAEGR